MSLLRSCELKFTEPDYKYDAPSGAIFMPTISVVGAGFSGLTTAYFLTKHGFKVRIIEKTERAGGLIKTIRTEHGLVETAANGLLSSARLEAMCADIGVPLQATRLEARARFI